MVSVPPVNFSEIRRVFVDRCAITGVSAAAADHLSPFRISNNTVSLWFWPSFFHVPRTRRGKTFLPPAFFLVCLSRWFSRSPRSFSSRFSTVFALFVFSLFCRAVVPHVICLRYPELRKGIWGLKWVAYAYVSTLKYLVPGKQSPGPLWDSNNEFSLILSDTSKPKPTTSSRCRKEDLLNYGTVRLLLCLLCRLGGNRIG